MSSVTSDSDTTLDSDNPGGGTTSTLIKFYEYYDENGNIVSETGYLLDADGNLVVASDSDLTGAYTATAADGTVYTVGEDATIVNNMIKSTVDSDVDGVSVDYYGNLVTTDGYLIDQSDGTSLLSITAGTEIVAQTSASATDSDGYTVTILSTDGYSFEVVDSDTGTAYAIVGTVDATYYDSYGSLVSDTGGYIINEDGTRMEVDSDTVESGTYYALVSEDESGNTITYYYPVTSTSAGSYYVLASGDATAMYFNGTQITDSNIVYYDSSSSSYYLMDGTTTTLSSTTYFVYGANTDSTTTLDDGVTALFTETSSVDNGSQYVYISVTTSATSHTYTIYYGEASTAATGNWRSTSPSSVVINSVTYYFENYIQYSASGTSPTVANLLSALGLNVSDGYILSHSKYSSTTDTFASGTTFLYAWSNVYLRTSLSGAVTTPYFTTDQSLSLYVVSDSASSLYYDSDSSSAVSQLATEVSIYMGYELYYDATGAWVTQSASGTGVYYLADTSATSAATYLFTTYDSGDEAFTQQSTYTYNGHQYLGTATSSGNYYYFTSSANTDLTVYSSESGFFVDEGGYILDATGEKQLLTTTHLYVYTQSVTDTLSSETTTYTYIFGESDLSVYLDEDTATDVTDESDPSITYTYYEVKTGYKGTYYRDTYGNYVNAAGYLIDPDTLDIIYTVSEGLKAGYSFTALDGTTYIVSADAAIDVEGGTYTVYSGVATIRYYGDDNGNETLDAYDTEYTSDELWIILRNELDEVTSYVSVEDGTEYTKDEWEAEYATDTTTDSTAATVS